MSNFSNKKPQINRFDKNPNRSSNKNLNNRPNKSTPELVGAPIRREDPKKNSNRQNFNKHPDPINVLTSLRKIVSWIQLVQRKFRLILQDFLSLK